MQLIETTDRAAISELLARPEYIDVVIPRGGRGLIERVTAEAKMPVIKHYDGNCHVYVDQLGRSVDGCRDHRQFEVPAHGCLQRMRELAGASQRIGSVAAARARELQSRRIEIRGDAGMPHSSRCRSSLGGRLVGQLGPIASVKVVEETTEAIEHINGYRITPYRRDRDSRIRIRREVPVTGRFQRPRYRERKYATERQSELGLGAEIGIGTDKLRARQSMRIERTDHV
ncbi:MAG: hypothetical protein U0892_07490 [Pirellulales bacterium]